MQRYRELGIEYFNPQVDDWDEAFADVEAEHMAEDAIILFPVTSETYATGSLAESGFSALNAIRLNVHRDFVIMIDRRLDESLDDPLTRKESLRARALVSKHLEKLDLANVYMVDSLETMLEVSIRLHRIAVERLMLENFRSRT
jgi:hypothetical protein